MPTPPKPNVIKISGTTAYDKITVLVTDSTGATVRGLTTTNLDANGEAQVNLPNFATNYVDGDLVIVTESGKSLGGNNANLNSGGASITITGTTVAFPSRSL